MRGAATSTMVMRFFTAMALKEFRHCGRASRDARAFASGIRGVQNLDRNIFLNSGQHRRWVQNFRSEVGQLCGLIETDDLDAPRIGTAHARVGGHHAVHVGPNFDAFGFQSSARDGGGVV